jgi:ABC-type spermidine/putrescine transport system permease subunit II
MDAINVADTLGESMGEGDIDTGSGTSATDEIISVMDIEMLFANMKVGTGLVTYVVKLVNDIYDIINRSGVQMLIFLAGLQSISPAIYEACDIEGATAWETFWKITFPMISPMILVNGVYTIIDSFTSEANIVMSYIANKYDAGRELATAMSWIYFVVIMAIIGIVALIASSYVFYQKRD